MSNIPIEVIAYLAGHFDGEGCIDIALGSDGRPSTARVIVGITYLPTLELYKKHFGGNIYARQKLPNRKENWVWGLQSRVEVAKFLLIVEPYLIEKKVKALQAMEVIFKRLSTGSATRHGPR